MDANDVRGLAKDANDEETASSREVRGWWAGRDDEDETRDRELAIEWVVFMDHLDALRGLCRGPR